jgi:bifunctional non-homologous end joining protein LigD
VRIPVARGQDREDVTRWTDDLAASIADAAPDLPHPRSGTGQRDALVAYTVRSAPGAPVVVPIEWDDLDDPALRSGRVTIRSALDRIAERGDLLHDLQSGAARLPRLR